MTIAVNRNLSSCENSPKKSWFFFYYFFLFFYVFLAINVFVNARERVSVTFRSANLTNPRMPTYRIVSRFSRPALLGF